MSKINIKKLRNKISVFQLQLLLHGNNNRHLDLLFSYLRIMRNTNYYNLLSLILILIPIEIHAWNSLLLRVVWVTNLRRIHIRSIHRKSLRRWISLIWIICYDCWTISSLNISINSPATEYSFPPYTAANYTHNNNTNNRYKSCYNLANIKSWIIVLVILINSNFIVILIVVVEYQHILPICLKLLWIVIVHWTEIIVVLIEVWVCGVVSHISYKKIPFSFILY